MKKFFVLLLCIMVLPLWCNITYGGAISNDEGVVVPIEKKGEEEIQTEQDDYLLMNWGASGDYDNSLYAAGPNATWEIVVDDNNHHYRYNRNILYDFN